MSGRRRNAWKELQAAVTEGVSAAGATEPAGGQARLPRPSRVYSKMLASPLRRCILTNKVLPSSLLIKIQLARILSSPTPRLTFTPSLLHPRFSPPLAGRAAYLACSHAALSLAALRGAHKRHAPSAAWPASFAAQVHSQLARRVEQEGELLFERARARSAWVGGEGEGVEGGRRLRRSPVGRVEAGEWERVLEEGYLGGLDCREGRQVGAVLRFGSGGLGELDEDRLSWLLPLANPNAVGGPARTLAQPRAPVYSLTHFLNKAQLPPSAVSGGLLAERVQHWLDATVTLFARREANVATNAAETLPTSDTRQHDGSDAVFVIYTPSVAGSRTVLEGDDDVVPLLEALWRCRLWAGEGWEGEAQPEIDPDNLEP